MQFTPGQLREVVGISMETFRHWKRVLPPFAKRKRHTPSFTVGDLLAGRILRRLTEGCGVRVVHLTEVTNEIVSVCNMAVWASLEHKSVLIDLVRGTCRLAGQNDDVRAFPEKAELATTYKNLTCSFQLDLLAASIVRDIVNQVGKCSRPEDVIVVCTQGPIMRDGPLRSYPSANRNNLLFPPVEVERDRSTRRRGS